MSSAVSVSKIWSSAYSSDDRRRCTSSMLSKAIRNEQLIDARQRQSEKLGKHGNLDECHASCEIQVRCNCSQLLFLLHQITNREIYAPWRARERETEQGQCRVIKRIERSFIVI